MPVVKYKFKTSKMITTNFNLQPNFLENEITKLIPLQEKHFEELFEAASDPFSKWKICICLHGNQNAK